MAFSAFYDQLAAATLAVVAEESGFPAFWAIDRQGEPAGSTSQPIRLNRCTAFWAPGF